MISDVHSLAMLQFEERQFQHFKLEENIRLELLDYVNTLSKAYSSIAEPPAVITFGGPEGEVRSRGEKIQNNSIANGESNLFLSDELTEDTVVGNVLLKLIKEWGTNKSEESHTPKLLSAWYVIMRSGDFHVLHEHSGQSGSQVSGAVYLNVPQNLPEPQGNINWIMSDAHTVTSSSPKTGDIFLWPSYLLHTIYPFSSDEERIMISFNGL